MSGGGSSSSTSSVAGVDLNKKGSCCLTNRSGDSDCNSSYTSNSSGSTSSCGTRPGSGGGGGGGGVLRMGEKSKTRNRVAWAPSTFIPVERREEDAVPRTSRLPSFAGTGRGSVSVRRSLGGSSSSRSSRSGSQRTVVPSSPLAAPAAAAPGSIFQQKPRPSPHRPSPLRSYYRPTITSLGRNPTNTASSSPSNSTNVLRAAFRRQSSSSPRSGESTVAEKEKNVRLLKQTPQKVERIRESRNTSPNTTTTASTLLPRWKTSCARLQRGITYPTENTRSQSKGLRAAVPVKRSSSATATCTARNVSNRRTPFASVMNQADKRSEKVKLKGIPESVSSSWLGSSEQANSTGLVASSGGPVVLERSSLSIRAGSSLEDQGANEPASASSFTRYESNPLLGGRSMLDCGRISPVEIAAGPRQERPGPRLEENFESTSQNNSSCEGLVSAGGAAVRVWNLDDEEDGLDWMRLANGNTFHVYDENNNSNSNGESDRVENDAVQSRLERLQSHRIPQDESLCLSIPSRRNNPFDVSATRERIASPDTQEEQRRSPVQVDTPSPSCCRQGPDSPVFDQQRNSDLTVPDLMDKPTANLLENESADDKKLSLAPLSVAAALDAWFVDEDKKREEVNPKTVAPNSNSLLGTINDRTRLPTIVEENSLPSLAARESGESMSETKKISESEILPNITQKMSPQVNLAGKSFEKRVIPFRACFQELRKTQADNESLQAENSNLKAEVARLRQEKEQAEARVTAMQEQMEAVVTAACLELEKARQRIAELEEGRASF